MSSSHDDLLILPFIERFGEWEKLIERVQNVQEYAELTREYNRIKGIVLDKKEITQDDDKNFLHTIRMHWSWVIRDVSDDLLETIENRETKGQSFTKIVKEINSLKIEGQKEQQLIFYEEIYSRLQELADEIKESISNEKYVIKQNWKFTVINILIGSAIGFAISILATLVLKHFGIC